LGALLHQDQKNEEALGHFERRAALAVGRSRCALSDRLGAFAQGNIDRAQMELEQLVKDKPGVFRDARNAGHNYRLKHKADGERERAKRPSLVALEPKTSGRASVA